MGAKRKTGIAEGKVLFIERREPCLICILPCSFSTVLLLSSQHGRSAATPFVRQFCPASCA